MKKGVCGSVSDDKTNIISWNLAEGLLTVNVAGYICWRGVVCRSSISLTARVDSVARLELLLYRVDDCENAGGDWSAEAPTASSPVQC